MNFITMAVTNAVNFMSERVSAFGVTRGFMFLAPIALILLNLISTRCYNNFYTNGKAVRMSRKQDLKILAVYILSNIAILGIITFILCRITFTICCGLIVIIPITIILSIIAQPAALVTQYVSSFVSTFRARYILPIV